MTIPIRIALLALGVLTALPAVASANGLYLTPPSEPPPEPALSADEYPVTIHGSASEPEDNITLIEKESIGFKVTCAKVKLSNLTLTEAAPSFATPLSSFTECVAGESELKATVSAETCRYSYSELSNVDTNDFDATADITCSKGYGIKIEFSGCELSVPTQTLNLPAELYNNRTAKAVESSVEGTEVSFTSKGGATCFALGLGFSEKTHEDGRMQVQTVLSGEGDIYVAPKSFDLEAEKYSANVSGSRIYYPPYLVGNIIPIEKESASFNVSCNDASLSGGTLTEATPAFTLDATLFECVAGEAEIEATVEMNSCGYAHADIGFIADTRFKAPVSITCEASDTIEISFSGCELSIPPQALAPLPEHPGVGELIGVTESGNEFVFSFIEGREVDFTSKGGATCFALGLGFWEKTHEDGKVQLQTKLVAK